MDGWARSGHEGIFCTNEPLRAEHIGQEDI